MKSVASPGRHLLIDFWGEKNLRNISSIEKSLRDAASASGATVLEIRLHTFGQEAGVTGVAILAESHISIHTWPEIGYAALDVFLCGGCDPYRALPVLRATFQPTRERICEYVRDASAASD